jgi:uncharacterized protein (TIGR02996 family)
MHRFWNVVHRPPRQKSFAGASVTFCSGTTGRGEQTTTDFDDEEPAKAEADRLVAEKLAEGYVETTDQPLCGPHDSSLRRALEKALAEDPDDLAAHSAYADHLSELGDPRGEFIQIQLALEDGSLDADRRKAIRRREKALLKKHERTWLGPMAGYWIDKMDEVATPYNYLDVQGLTWRRGWVDSLTFHDGDPESAEAAMRRGELLRLVRELHLEHCYRYVDGGPAALLKGDFLSNVRVFRVGNDPPGGRSGDCFFSSETSMLDFLDRMPRLEELGLFARQAPLDRLFARQMPTMRILKVYHGREVHPLERLAKNRSLGNLTHLAIWPRGQSNDGDGEPYVTRVGFAALVCSPNLPKLQHLKLCLTEVGDEGVRILLESGLLKRLKTLNLHGGTVSDVGALALAACADLRNLESLTLSQNYLSSAGVEALRATGVKLNAGEQFSEENGGEHLDDGDCE